MTLQTQATSAPVPPATTGQPEQPAHKQPWRRPSVTFVPMQATAGPKSGALTDNLTPGSFTP